MLNSYPSPLPLAEELPFVSGCPERFCWPPDVLPVGQDLPSTNPKNFKVQLDWLKRKNVSVRYSKCKSDGWTIRGWKRGNGGCGCKLIKCVVSDIFFAFERSPMYKYQNVKASVACDKTCSVIVYILIMRPFWVCFWKYEWETILSRVGHLWYEVNMIRISIHCPKSDACMYTYVTPNKVQLQMLVALKPLDFSDWYRQQKE